NGRGERPFHEGALLWHGVELVTTRHRQQEGPAMVPHGRRERWPARHTDLVALAATGDRSTCPHQRPGSRSCTWSPAASPLPASSPWSTASPPGRCAPAAAP